MEGRHEGASLTVEQRTLREHLNLEKTEAWCQKRGQLNPKPHVIRACSALGRPKVQGFTVVFVAQPWKSKVHNEIAIVTDRLERRNFNSNFDGFRIIPRPVHMHVGCIMTKLSIQMLHGY